MAMTRAEINAKSDKKRGVRVQSYKLHEETINKLNALQDEFNMSKTQLVTEGIKQIMQITIHISEQCKKSNFYDIEYAGALYEELISSYPLAKIKFVFVRENNNIDRKEPYITSFSTQNVNMDDVALICKNICCLLVQKNKFRTLYSPTGDALPLQFKNFSTHKEIEDYLKENDVELSTNGYF